MRMPCEWAAAVTWSAVEVTSARAGATTMRAVEFRVSVSLSTSCTVVDGVAGDLARAGCR